MANILVVDDDRGVLDTIRLVLERGNHTVTTVDNSRAALRMIEDGGFDLFIVDIFMPGMDGFETMRVVRQSDPDMPILMMSGDRLGFAGEQRPDFLYMATKLGAATSLKKPFRPAELLNAVNRSLNARSVCTASTQPGRLPE